MELEELEAEKIRFKYLLRLIEDMNAIPFTSEAGKGVASDMKVCYTEIIRPIIVNKMNELVKLEK